MSTPKSKLGFGLGQVDFFLARTEMKMTLSITHHQKVRSGSLNLLVKAITCSGGALHGCALTMDEVIIREKIPEEVKCTMPTVYDSLILNTRWFLENLLKIIGSCVINKI
jgi:hypothetical protein